MFLLEVTDKSDHKVSKLLLKIVKKVIFLWGVLQIKTVVVWAPSSLNSRSDWLLGFNEFNMAAGVVIRIQDGGPYP